MSSHFEKKDSSPSPVTDLRRRFDLAFSKILLTPDKISKTLLSDFEISVSCRTLYRYRDERDCKLPRDYRIIEALEKMAERKSLQNTNGHANGNGRSEPNINALAMQVLELARADGAKDLLIKQLREEIENLKAQRNSKRDS